MPVQLFNLRIERRGDELHIISPLWKQIDARQSASGRSWVLASTEGPCDLRPLDSSVKVPVMVEVNVYIPKGPEDESSRPKL